MAAKDKGFSWVVAMACCTINCLLYGVTRLSGLLLVSTVDTFQVTRATAAIPFSVSTSVRNLSGIFVGYLGQKFGLRLVISTGCILASLGAGLCFFVSDVFWITVFWGGMFGIGCGLATCLLPLAINDHFDKHRGTALGLSYSGSYIGSFIFPPIVAQLIERYGLPGAFLVISAALLNGLAISMLFRTPSPENASADDNNHTAKDACKESSLLQSHGVSGGYYKRIWFKLIYHIKKFLWLLQVSSSSGVRIEVPIHLTSAVSLADPDEVTASPKQSVQVCGNVNNVKPNNYHLRPRAGDSYLRCKSTTFNNNKSESKNRISKLRKIAFSRYVRKRYNFCVSSEKNSIVYKINIYYKYQ